MNYTAVFSKSIIKITLCYNTLVLQHAGLDAKNQENCLRQNLYARTLLFPL